MFRNFHPRKRTIIIGSIIIVLVVAIAAVVGIYAIQRQAVVTRIKNDLIKVGEGMEAGRDQTKAYPAAIPTAAQPSDGVKISGGGSFDGVSYCIDGTAEYNNKPITFHIDSETSQQGPQADSCVNGTDIAPSAPAGLTINSVGPNTIAVSWNAAVAARAYNVQCASDDQFKNDVVTTRYTVTTGNCDGLKQSTLYYIRVEGMNKTKEGKWSTPIQMRTAILSVVPSNFKVTATSNTQVSYSWDPVPGATSYILQQSTDVNFIGGLINIKQTGTSGVSKNLKPATMYFYHVQAITPNFTASSAAFSDELTAQTPN
jgi:hypothetical protein